MMKSGTYGVLHADLSMDILCACNRLPLQRGFFKYSTGNLLPVLRFLGGLYNFCNFVIIFFTTVITSRWYVEEQHILQIWKFYRSASLQKLKTMEEIMPDTPR